MLKGIKNIDYVAIVIICIMAILLLFNISNRYMFADEAIEALIGKNILKFGLPKVWDGNNLALAGVNGNEFNESLIPIRNNWLPYYVAAFGQWISNYFHLDVQNSVGIMRGFFSLIGILGASAYYFLVKELCQNRVITIFSLCLFAFSVPLLLYIRAIYYLAPTLTFAITTVLFYLKYISSGTKGNLTLFTVSSVLLFHSFYPYFFIVMLSLVIVYFIIDFKKNTFLRLLISSTVILILTIPWYIYIRMYLSKVETSAINSISILIKTFLGYVWQIHAYFFPFIPVCILGSIFMVVNIKKKGNDNSNKKSIYIPYKEKVKRFWQQRKKYKSHLLIFLLIIINMIVITVSNSFLDTRRLLIAIPFIFIVFACMLYNLYKNVKVIGLFILCISIFTNILHILPYMFIRNFEISKVESVVKPPLPFFDADSNWRNKKASLSEYLESICKIESYPINYLEEILNTYEDADKGMVEFLTKYAKRGQKVYLIGYQYETIAFYTDLQVVNRLNPLEDPLPSAYKKYPNAQTYQHLTKFPVEDCDWVIERRLSSQVDDNALWHDEDKFERFYINSPDSKPWNEIWDHSFYTDWKFEGIYIYRNRMTNNAIAAD